MNLLITGATGLLGRALINAFHTEPHRVLGTGWSRVEEPLMQLDLCDPDAVTACLNHFSPDIIVHAAAERRPDVSQQDPKKTEQLNVGATARLAEWASQQNCWLLYISTDYVFDGTNPPYAPDSATNPLNAYGKSKRDGELAVRQAGNNSCILRVPILYGAVETLGESPVTALAAQMLKLRTTGEPLPVDHWAVRYPTLVDDVAAVIRNMVAHRIENPSFSGTVHWSGDEAMTKYDMARIMAPLIGFDADRLVPLDTPSNSAPRPRDSHLDCSILENAGLGQRTPFQQAIEPILRNSQ